LVCQTNRVVGFRFDDVKDYPPEIVEDLLWNSMGFPVAVEGRYILTARLSNLGDPPARLYIKVDYLGPATSALF
jgi:hypothetical protein